MQDRDITTIDAYIATFPGEVQVILRKIRALIHQVAPEATEAISFGLATFKLGGKTLVHFAAWQHHIGFYLTPSDLTASNTELAPYKHAKGSAQFPLNQPIPYDLIKKMTEFRIKELEGKL